MNKSHGFTKENLLRSLPPGLANDPRMVALAEAIAGLLVQQKEETGRLSIYPQIGKLDEALLDILAHDFKVDWWDSDYTLTEKRRTLQTSWQVHKTLGTKAAVQKAITAIFPNTTIEEWFEYGGQPYPVPTTARYTITIPPDDLAGTNISEAALVDADGVLCAIRNMLPKGKDAGVSFTATPMTGRRALCTGCPPPSGRPCCRWR